MTDRPVSAFMLSATLHGVVVAFLLLLSYAAKQQVQDMPRVLELVAGAGDNFAARVAPALGVSGGVTLEIPAPPQPKAEPAPIIQSEPPTPKITPAPAPTPKKAVETAPNFAQQIRRQVIVGESKAKMQIARERKAEQKRLAEEKKRQAAEEKKRQAQMTKEEFDRMNKAKAATAKKNAPPKIAKIDAEGIAKGVVGGSTENKIGGAGGRALASDNDDRLAAYFAMLRLRIKAAFEPPPGLSDTLTAVVQVRSNANGSLTSARITKSSGSRDFDDAVLAALRQTQMPARPDNRSETIEFPFSLRERDE